MASAGDERGRGAVAQSHESANRFARGSDAKNKKRQFLAGRPTSYYLAALDQGLFATSNLAINLLLARWLEPEQYGAFAVGFSILTCLFTGYSAVLLEPLLVFGAERYSGRFREYFAIVICSHAAIMAGAMALLAFAAMASWWGGSLVMAKVLLGLAISAPFIILSWLARTACYARSELRLAVAAGALHLFVAMAVLDVLYCKDRLSPGLAFVAMGLAGLAGGGWLTAKLRPRWRSPHCGLNLRSVLEEHWTFGAWNIIAAGLWWASGQIVFVAAPVFLGLQAVAVLAAMMNLMRPLNPLARAFTDVFLTSAAGLMDCRLSGLVVHRFVRRNLLIAIGAVLLYGGLLCAFSRPLLRYIYAGRYDAYSPLLAIITASYTASIAQQICGNVIKAKGDTKLLASVWSIPPVVTLLLMVPAVVLHSLTILLGALTLAYALGALLSWRSATRLISL